MSNLDWFDDTLSAVHAIQGINKVSEDYVYIDRDNDIMVVGNRQIPLTSLTLEDMDLDVQS